MKVIVTGGAGFIGSALVWKLNSEGVTDILIVDNLGESEKWRNLLGLSYSDYRHKDDFLPRLLSGELGEFDAVVHLGACSVTTEKNSDYLMENNFRYTKTLAEWCVARNVRFLYASSGQTYGDGELGFSDSDALAERLRPITRYGYSKHLFDLHALRTGLSKNISGIKFFNVFGPNEYHKDDMRSVVHKAFHQIKDEGLIRLFRSYRDAWPDGGQTRDFVYVKDCVDVLWWLLQNPKINGIYNLGTGVARSWNDLAHAIFSAMDLAPNITYIDMPERLIGNYQYHTQATTEKLRAAGYTAEFTNLEDAVRDYVGQHLATSQPYLTTK
jgi:ADP-L-glycero-D-manno-heptose 6-epimerase